MPNAFLRLDPLLQRAAWAHLVYSGSGVEEAAFVYAAPADGDDEFRIVEWWPVPPEGFASRSAFHLELSDETRAQVIKRAHDLGASLVELHSHLGPGPARFSWSDLSGFEEFVPHVWWRLKGRPYFALVVVPESFDGLAWRTGPAEPERLGGLLVGSVRLEPSNRSNLTMQWDDDAQ